MPNTALNRTTQVLLTNKSGGNLSYGDVVVLDNTNTNGFTTTTTAGLSTRGLGVILEPSGIANNASGMVAVGGWCPKVNLNTAAAIGQFIKTHTVAGQGTPHASPQVEGDFAVALSASATPPCSLFGSPNGPLAGGAGTVTNTGTLTSGKTIIGNGSADVTVSSLTAQFVGSSSGTAAAASMTTARLLGRTTASSGAVEEITVGTGLTLSAGSLTASAGQVLLEQHTASSSASLDFTSSISGTYDDYLIRVVNIVPATNGANLAMRLSTNGGSSYDSSAIYDWGGVYGYTGGSGALGATNQTSWPLSGASSNSANYGIIGTLNLIDPARTSGYKLARMERGFFDSGVSALLWNGANYAYRSATAVNAFQFFMSSGNITSGVIRVYGVAK
jgi:hypothetical protein